MTRAHPPRAVAAFLLDWLWLPLNYCGIAKECLASPRRTNVTRRRCRRVPKRKEESHECG